MTSLDIFIILFPKELVIRWATDVYVFGESEIGIVELVTDSTFEVSQVSIQGFPRQISDDNPNRFPSLVVPGPSYPGTGEMKQPSFCILLTLETLNQSVHFRCTHIYVCYYP